MHLLQPTGVKSITEKLNVAGRIRQAKQISIHPYKLLTSLIFTTITNRHHPQ